MIKKHLIFYGRGTPLDALQLCQPKRRTTIGNRSRQRLRDLLGWYFSGLQSSSNLSWRSVGLARHHLEDDRLGCESTSRKEVRVDRSIYKQGQTSQHAKLTSELPGSSEAAPKATLSPFAFLLHSDFQVDAEPTAAAFCSENSRDE